MEADIESWGIEEAGAGGDEGEDEVENLKAAILPSRSRARALVIFEDRNKSLHKESPNLKLQRIRASQRKEPFCLLLQVAILSDRFTVSKLPPQ